MRALQKQEAAAEAVMAVSPDAKGNRGKKSSVASFTLTGAFSEKKREQRISDPHQILSRRSWPSQPGPGGWVDVPSGAPGRTLSWQPGRPSVFVVTADFAFRLLQQIQHLFNDGLQCPAQLVCVVRLAQGGHMDKG